MANSITRVEIRDFLAFRGEFEADFCSGVIVLIGGNGTGKTTLLKCLYESVSNSSDPSVFTPDYQAALAGLIINGDLRDDSRRYNIATINNEAFINAVFIPTDEMLSHSKGLIALDRDRKMPFDKTQIDVLALAEYPETRKTTPNAAKVLDKIKAVIGGEVSYENDTFYVIKDELGKLPFSLEASGFRKLGLLWKLLRNGLLESGSILFWDEPEASINPELIPTLVDILLELQRGGVQIFVATHNYDVARWFELNKQSENTLRYFNLRKEGGGIIADTADDYISLDDNLIETAGEKLYSRVVEVAAANVGVNLK
jgi:AAA15 family ATPase/GTPase